MRYRTFSCLIAAIALSVIVAGCDDESAGVPASTATVTMTSTPPASAVTSPTATTPVPTATTAPPAAPAEVQLMDADSGRSVEVAKGGTVIVVLTSNLSTGYAWEASPAPAPVLTQAGDPVYVPPGSTQPVPGAPGAQKFTFSADAPGTVTLQLIYHRSWETGVPPIKTFSVTVTVR